MNHREFAKKIMAMWLSNDGELPDDLDDASEEEAIEWTTLTQEVLDESAEEDS